jgi:uncharacterized membrane protein YkvI
MGTNREEICWLVRRLCVGVAKLLYLLLYGTRYDMLYHLENRVKSMAQASFARRSAFNIVIASFFCAAICNESVIASLFCACAREAGYGDLA